MVSCEVRAPGELVIRFSRGRRYWKVYIKKCWIGVNLFGIRVLYSTLMNMVWDRMLRSSPSLSLNIIRQLSQLLPKNIHSEPPTSLL
jgi:hypothetical protein